jgi:hypothetical protein
MEGDLESFELADGSQFYFDPQSPELFLYTCECAAAQGEDKTTFPEPPDVIKAIARAKDRVVAYDLVFGHDHAGAFVDFPFEYEALIEAGKLIPRSMVVEREIGEPLTDLSED